MADQETVRRIARTLPEVTEDTSDFGFGVRRGAKQAGLAWAWKERVDPKGPRVPNPDVLAVRVANQAERAILLASDERKFFTEPHYNNFPAVLVRLAEIDETELAELLTDAWRHLAPPKLVRQFDVDHAPPAGDAQPGV